MMKSLKMSVFALGISLSMGAIAESTLDSTTGAERDLDRPSSNRSFNVRDCNIRNGNDKLLCEQQLQNDAARLRLDEHSRINRDSEDNMIDESRDRDLRFRDLDSRDLQSGDKKLNNSQPLNNSQQPLNNSQPLDSSVGDVPISSTPSTSGSDNSGTGTSNGH